MYRVEDLLNKFVYTSRAKLVGIVTQVINDASGICMLVKLSDKLFKIRIDDIAVVGDIVILRDGARIELLGNRVQQSSAMSSMNMLQTTGMQQPLPNYVAPTCPNDGTPMTYHPQLSMWICPRCGRTLSISMSNASTSSFRCPSCGTPLTYLQHLGRWFCPRCGKVF